MRSIHIQQTGISPGSRGAKINSKHLVLQMLFLFNRNQVKIYLYKIIKSILVNLSDTLCVAADDDLVMF